MKNFAPNLRCLASLAVLAALVLTPGCGKKPAANVLAQVGSQVVTIEDFKAEVARRLASHQLVGSRESVMQELVGRAALLERARAAGLEKSPDVQRALQVALIAKLKDVELAPQIAATKVSPEELRAAYAANRARFTQPAKAHLAIIYLAANSKMNANQFAEISARATEARSFALALPTNEKDFGQVAAKFSEDQVGRYRGGEAGWFSDDVLFGRWPKEIIAAGLALKNSGDVSDVLTAKDGFYLVKKIDARAAVVTPLEAASANLEHQLLLAKRKRVTADFRTTVLSAVKVQTDSALLSRMEFPTQAVANADALPPSLPATP
ncbi:MAG: hypothetical protein RLZZ350_1826 [Verrucomicrobiota bacterium]|jgi:peptidylprolyl isomerase